MFILTEGNIRLVLSVIVIIALVIILIRFRVRKGEQKGSLDILKERLDKGEITKEDYLETLRRQKGNRHS